jgi:hypothetical protein
VDVHVRPQTTSGPKSVGRERGTTAAPRAALALDLRRERYPFFAGAGPQAPLLGVDLVAHLASTGQ